MKEFYMLQLGVHLYTLIDHVFLRLNEPKYYEVLLHHGVSVFLIFFSYLSNSVAVGSMVLFTHDPGDIFLDLSRVYNDYKGAKKSIVIGIFLIFVVQWIFLRLYVFPWCIIRATIDFSLSLT